MTLMAASLLLIAAVAHAWWNVMGKQRNPSAAFFLYASVAGMVCLAPVLLWHAGLVTAIPGRVWVLLILTGVCQAVYYIGLARAYRLGHVSLAYPLARAVPVVLVPLLNLALGLGRQIGPMAFAGMVIIGVGCVMLPMQRLRELRLRHYLHASSLMALLAAVGTCGYMMIDNEALAVLQRKFPSTVIGKAPLSVLYLMLEMGMTAVWLALYVAITKPERTDMREIDRRGTVRACMAGILIVTAYGLVLLSMSYVSNVSYVVAFRQISIPIGVAMGVVLLKEPCPRPKVLGVAMLLFGLLMVGLG